jgi:hypothetical protein
VPRKRVYVERVLRLKRKRRIDHSMRRDLIG